MRILIDARLLTRGNISGIEDYARGVINEMLKNHKEHTYGFFWSGIKKVSFPDEWRAENVFCINWSFPNKILDTLIRLFGWPKVDRIWPADIIWSPHFFLLPKSKRTKRVITFHDLSPEHFPELYPLRKRIWHWQQNYKTQARDADHLVAVSDFTRKDLINTFSVDPKKVTAIHSGINPFFKELDAEDEELKKFCKKNNIRTPFFLFVGTLEPRKNVPEIIRAFNIVKSKKGCTDCNLIIVGKRGWLFESIFSEASKSPYKEDIRFWGEATYQDLLCLYNTASAFVWPSLFEGFGHPPLEAQACGCPVIASNRSSLPEVLGDSAILISPHNLEELSVAMESLILQNSIREMLIERGRENCRRFNWRKTSDTLIKTLEQTQNHG